MKIKYDFIGLSAIVVAMIIWASSFIGLKVALADYGTYTVIFLRMIFASLCFIFFIKRFLKYSFTKSDIKYIFLMSAFEPCLYFLFEAQALQLTTASQAGMIASLMPIMTAVAAVIVLSEKISKQFVLGAILSFIGALWLSFASDSTHSSPNPLLGNFLEFLAMACGAGYTIIIRKLSYKFSALFLTASQAFIGAVFFLPFALYEYLNAGFVYKEDSFLWIVYLGIVVSLGGYGLYNFALTRIEAAKASIFLNLIPIFTLIIAYIILDERLTYVEIIASVLILLGVFISQVKITIPKRFYRLYKKI